MKKSTKRAVEIGAGALTAAAIAAAAGVYFFSGEEGRKRKAKARAWIESARKEVVKNAKVARHLGKEEYQRLAEKAVKHYGQLEHMTAKDIAAAARELKGEWDQIQKKAHNMMKEANAPKRKKPAARRKGRARAK